MADHAGANGPDGHPGLTAADDQSLNLLGLLC